MAEVLAVRERGEARIDLWDLDVHAEEDHGSSGSTGLSYRPSGDHLGSLEHIVSGHSDQSSDPPLEGWWAPIDGTSSPDVHGKVEREIHRGRDELDVLVKGIQAPAGSQVDVVFDHRVVATAPLEQKRRLFGGSDGRVRIIVDASSLPAMRTGDRLLLQVDGRPVAEAELRPD